MDLNRPLMNLIKSYNDLKRPFMGPDKVSYGPKSPLVDLIRSHMGLKRPLMDLKRHLMDLMRSHMVQKKASYGPKQDCL